MQTRQEAILYCHSFQNMYENYPFHDDNWCVLRHKKIRRRLLLFIIKVDVYG